MLAASVDLFSYASRDSGATEAGGGRQRQEKQESTASLSYLRPCGETEHEPSRCWQTGTDEQHTHKPFLAAVEVAS